jgi:hypothetical protein
VVTFSFSLAIGRPAVHAGLSEKPPIPLALGGMTGLVL